jgi:Trypsin
MRMRVKAFRLFATQTRGDSMCKLLAVFFCSSLFVAAASGIIIRDDRPDLKYVELGAQFPAECSIGRAGEGTLVAAQWVITAAHVAKGSSSPTVNFDGVEYPIEAKYIFPNWQDMGPNDIGLIKLAKPVEGIAPVPVYEDADESGKQVVFVGRGGTGTGLTGPTGEDRKKRGATNTVVSVEKEWLHFIFHEPASASELEGISGPGDSGGPAFIQRSGKYYVAGLSVWGQPGKNGRGTYGALEGYTRVSSYIGWIRDTMGGKNQPLTSR